MTVLRNGKITIVSGLPGSGKNYFIEQRRKAGEMILDVDEIFVALGSPQAHKHCEEFVPFVCEARDAILRRFHRPHEVKHAWIIISDKTAASIWALDLKADHVHLDVAEDERKRRLKVRSDG